MEQVFQQLADIHKVEPSSNLYNLVMNSVEKPKIIHIIWLRVAVAVFVVFFSLELFLVKKQMDKDEMNQLKMLVPQSQNILYNE